MIIADLIIGFAQSRDSFTLSELSGFVREWENISDSGLLWHINKLIRQNQLSRLSRGLYARQAKREFAPTLPGELKRLYFDLTKVFPLIDIVLYSGNDINSLQHHLAANNAIYVEVTKEATEAVFHYLMDNKIKAYHKPNKEFMTDYVDLSEKPVIIKALTSEAPTKDVDGVRMPALEKMLVDINADSDFYYLQGDEAFYIMQNARSLYNINIPKMLRYASRRGLRDRMQAILDYND